MPSRAFILGQSTCCERGELVKGLFLKNQEDDTLCSVARRHFPLDVGWVINMLDTDSLSQWIITVRWTEQRHMGKRMEESQGVPFLLRGSLRAGKGIQQQKGHFLGVLTTSRKVYIDLQGIFWQLVRINDHFKIRNTFYFCDYSLLLVIIKSRTIKHNAEL